MKIVLEITPTEDDNGREMVYISLKRDSGKYDSMAVLRATARFIKAIRKEHNELHWESEFIKAETDDIEKGEK